MRQLLCTCTVCVYSTYMYRIVLTNYFICKCIEYKRDCTSLYQLRTYVYVYICTLHSMCVHENQI